MSPSYTAAVGLRSWLVRRTEREGLLYLNAIALDLAVRRTLNLRNRLLRPMRIARYLAEHPVRRVQFGAGGTRLEGFLDSDLLGRIPIDIARRLPFPDSSIDLFYSNHLVEHIHRRDFRRFLAESRRCLRPGGRHLFATPSLERLARTIYGGGDGDEAAGYLLAYHARTMEHPITRAEFLNGIMHINYGHRFLYDRDTVERMARDAGYSGVEKLADNRRTGLPEIDAYLAGKDRSWDLESETFVLSC